eukprot:s2087_g12.t1
MQEPRNTDGLHDRIAKAVLSQYDGLPGRAKPQGRAWTVLAGIVAETHGDLEVLALATGTRCIGVAAMVAGCGQVVHDCHAEVLCRRAFHRFLLSEMLYVSDDGLQKEQRRSSILEMVRKEELLFSLRSDVNLHFYVSALPCGECTLVPLQSKEGTLARKMMEEKEAAPLNDRNRTGAKPSRGMPNDPKAEGKDFHQNGILRYKSGRSDTRPESRTVCYSCSDKICRWNRVGWQDLDLALLPPHMLLISLMCVTSVTPRRLKERRRNVQLGQAPLTKTHRDSPRLTKMRAKLRRKFSCLHRIRPEFAVILNDSAHPDDMQKACEEVLVCRERVLWTAGIEIVVAAVSFVGFDVRRSPLVPCVSSCLLLLASLGYHGALVLSQIETIVHTLLSTSIAAAVCVNFVIETFAGTLDSTATMPPVWLLLLALVLPYFALLCLAATSVFLGITMHDLRQMNEDSSISSEELETQAELARGQDMCCVCASERKDAALVPCGHKAMCYRCSCQVQSRGLACPLCRTPISRVLRVFE